MKEPETDFSKENLKIFLNQWVDEMNISAPHLLSDNETVAEILEKWRGFKKWAKSNIEKI